MRTKQLLFVTDVFPYPLDRGNRVRILNLLQACARDFAVTLVVRGSADEQALHVPKCVARVIFVGASPVGRSGIRQYLRAMRSVIGLPFGWGVRYLLEFVRALDTLDLRNFDLVWAERPHLGRLFTAQRARTIVDLDDIEHLRLRQLMGLQRVSRAWVHNLYRHFVYQRAECRLFRGFARLIVCTEQDRDYLLGRRAGAIGIVPNGSVVPAHRRKLRARNAGEPLRILFFGNMGHEPNDDAVRFLADEILPGAGASVASVDVIGPHASLDLRGHCAGRINFLGFVDDLAAAIGSYDVLVAPIRYGGGTKLKMIDAMAHGLPIVATDCAAEGLDLVDGRHALLASTSQGIRDALARLAQSPELGESLSAAAFAHAREHFSWDTIQATLAAELRQLCDARGRHGG
jgi:glycosyltransferase involved in cell wall biosynthesis